MEGILHIHGMEAKFGNNFVEWGGKSFENWGTTQKKKRRSYLSEQKIWDWGRLGKEKGK